MSSILKKFSFVDLSSKKNESNDSPKPIRSNSLRSQFTRSLDSITSTLRQSFGRTKSKHSNSSNSSLDGVTLQHKSSGKKEKLMGGRAFMSRLNFGPKIPSTDISRPKFDDDSHMPTIVHCKPQKAKNNEFLLTQGAALIKPKPIYAKDSSKTLSPGSSFKDTDIPRSLPKDVQIPEPVPKISVDLKPDTPETRQKSLASLMNGSAKLSPHFTTRYILGDMLGDGAFGFVFTAKRISDSVEVAVKFIIRTKLTKDHWVDHGLGKVPCEVDTLQKLHHPNIIKYIEHIVEDEYVLLITELFGTSWDASNHELDPVNNPGLKFRYHKILGDSGKAAIKSRTSCDLFECIDAHTRIPISKAKYLFAQIVLACDYLQSVNLVHRDIKDENIVVNSKYEIKLIDFGSASSIPTRHQDYFTRYNGTPHFAAPEIAAGNTYQGPQAEVWTLGVLLYTIIFGENPFQDKKDILAYNGLLTFPRFIETDLQKLIEQMLCINVRRRITLESVKSHPWCAFQISSLKKQYEERESQFE